jgi:hypothetical protein
MHLNIAAPSPIATRSGAPARRLSYESIVAAILSLILLCGYMQPSAAAGSAPLSTAPPGAARLWIYREYEPSDTLARPFVRLNGAVIAISDPGGSFFRDVPPGVYTVTVDTVGHDVNQFVTIALAAGQTVFVKVESSRLWESDLNYTADTFYTRLIPPETAAREIARSRVLFY